MSDEPIPPGDYTAEDERLTDRQVQNIAAAQSLYLDAQLMKAERGEPVNMEEILEMATVPLEEIFRKAEPEPLASKVPTYDDLMALIQRVQDTYYRPAPDDWFEAVRHEGETRSQAKSRVMLEEYSLSGRVIRDRDLWGLRAQYVRVRQYVQGAGGGLPYDTHNWVHYYSRYGSGGAREVSLMIGLRKDTVAEMGRAGVMESEARRTLRILGH